ncbi:MAG TPA: VWA domain-containing protein [Candidatus Gallacutalibacter stercoravium]|nr:VWA domain-containing protein [Candidatus Gallacutalibacter stercoravium]
MRKKFLSLALCLLLALVIPAGVFAQGIEWDVSKSKTATNLDDNYEANVTLSLPSAEEQLVTDVVFVLDKSTSTDIEQDALNMLQNLQTQVQETNAQVKVGVVIFNKEAHASDWMDLKTQYADIENAMRQEISSGTNTHAGLLAGKAMLDADTTVDASRKYMIFVSDAITYMYNEEPTVTAWSFMSDSVLCWAGPDNWYSKYGTNNPPENWDTWLSSIGQQVEVQGTQYEYPYEGEVKQATPVEEKDIYANSIDKALYLTNEVYQEAKSAGYHCYAVTNGTSTDNLWGPSFMKYLAGGKDVSFEQIQNDILYLVDAGSRVEDTLGYVEGEYDFNLKGIDTFQLTVKGQALAATVDAANNCVYFGEKDAAGKYPYEVLYTPGEKDAEKFTLTFNVPVSNFAPVQLSYTVVLANPKTEAGTYGQYDANGSLGYDGLYTNNSAILYPKDTNGVEGPSEVFPMPTVSYTVKPVSSQPEESSSVPEESSSQPESQPENSSSEVSNTPAGSSSAAPSNSSTASNPKTGESNSMEVWVVLLAVAAACLTVSAMVTIRKKAK